MYSPIEITSYSLLLLLHRLNLCKRSTLSLIWARSGSHPFLGESIQPFHVGLSILFSQNPPWVLSIVLSSLGKRGGILTFLGHSNDPTLLPLFFSWPNNEKHLRPQRGIPCSRFCWSSPWLSSSSWRWRSMQWRPRSGPGGQHGTPRSDTVLQVNIPAAWGIRVYPNMFQLLLIIIMFIVIIVISVFFLTSYYYYCFCFVKTILLLLSLLYLNFYYYDNYYLLL